jgi:hypothetical protein
MPSTLSAAAMSAFKAPARRSFCIRGHKLRRNLSWPSEHHALRPFDRQRFFRSLAD